MMTPRTITSKRFLSTDEVDARLAACGLKLVNDYQEVHEDPDEDEVENKPSTCGVMMKSGKHSSAEMSFTEAAGVNFQKIQNTVISGETTCCRAICNKDKAANKTVSEILDGAFGETEEGRALSKHISDAIGEAVATILNEAIAGGKKIPIKTTDKMFNDAINETTHPSAPSMNADDDIVEKATTLLKMTAAACTLGKNASDGVSESAVAQAQEVETNLNGSVANAVNKSVISDAVNKSVISDAVNKSVISDGVNKSVISDGVDKSVISDAVNKSVISDGVDKSVISGGDLAQDDGTIGVMYNVHFGSFSINSTALWEYAQRIGMQDKAKIDALVLSGGSNMSRTDQVMVKIIEEMGGRAASGVHFKEFGIGILRVAKKYENYVKISEYDGSETPWVDTKKYLLDQLKRVLAEEDTNCEGKVKVMRRLFDEEPYSDDDECADFR